MTKHPNCISPNHTTSILPENWKKLWNMRVVICHRCTWNSPPKTREKDKRSGKSEGESRPSWPQQCKNQLEYPEESWRPKETCCHSDSNADVKKTKKQLTTRKIIIITINHIISECSKLAQKEYKTRHDWVGKVIHWEMCKKFKFDHTNKCYMHNPAPVLENDTHKLLWNFDIFTDHLISARRSDLIIITKKKKKKKKNEENMQNCRLCCSGWPQDRIERNWKEG